MSDAELYGFMQKTNDVEQAAHGLGKEIHPDPVPVCVCEELCAMHGMLHCIEHAHTAGVPVALLGNREMSSVVSELPMRFRQPPTQPLIERGKVRHSLLAKGVS